MMCAFRSLLISMALLAAAMPAAKGNPPAPRPAHKPPVPKPPPLPHLPKPPPRLPVPHPAHAAPRHLPPPRVTHHPRPIVYHGLVHHVRRSATPIVRQPVRHAAIRTVHRYPVHRLPFRFVHRWWYNTGFYGYNYSSYRGRYWWRNYNRGYGALQRRRPHVIGGIVESVQGGLGNGILVVKAFRPRSSRFR
jgi:glycosyltransferase involved in cell wall biosynthesis